MNSSNSSSTPFPTFFLVANIYTIPIVAVIGFFFNIICLAVLLHPKLKGDTYKYLIFKTLAHLYSQTATGMSPYGICSFCPISQTLGAQIFMIYFLIFLANTFFTYAALIEIVLAYERLLMFKQNSKWLIKLNLKLTLTIIVISGLIVNIPYLFAYRVAETSLGRFRWVFTEFGSSSFFRIYVIVLTIIQNCFPIFTLFTLNILVTIEFRNYLNRKSRLTRKKENTIDNSTKENENRQIELASTSLSLSNSLSTNQTSSKNDSNESSVKNFTMMIIVSSTIFAIIRLINLIHFSSLQIFRLNGVNSNSLLDYLAFANFFGLMLYYGINLFLYIKFNKNFKSFFKKIFMQCSSNFRPTKIKNNSLNKITDLSHKY
jgi:hypothetical protein